MVLGGGEGGLILFVMAENSVSDICVCKNVKEKRKKLQKFGRNYGSTGGG